MVDSGSVESKCSIVQCKGNTTVSGMQYKSEEGLTLAFQNGWDKEAYTNGKMWQVATLRPGKYRLEVTYAYTLVVTDAGNFYFCIDGQKEIVRVIYRM